MLFLRGYLFGLSIYFSGKSDFCYIGMNRMAAEKNCKLRFNLIVQTRRVKESSYVLLYAELGELCILVACLSLYPHLY